jgi:hypothetical protein
MFRQAHGFKARYGDLLLMAAEDFAEWRVLIKTPTSIVQGTRQFSGDKAKDHAVLVAEKYRQDNEAAASASPAAAGGAAAAEAAVAVELQWEPLEPGDWLLWY